MKKKLIITATCVVALTIGAFLLFRPMPLLSPPLTVAPGNIMEPEHSLGLLSVEYNGVFVNDYIDSEQLVEILSRYEMRLVWDNIHTLSMDEITWQIGLVRRGAGRSMRLVLGERSFLYTNANSWFMYRIINAEALMAELELLLPQSEQ